MKARNGFTLISTALLTLFMPIIISVYSNIHQDILKNKSVKKIDKTHYLIRDNTIFDTKNNTVIIIK